MTPTASAAVSTPGLYRMSAAEYHKGPCPGPELSASIAKIITQETPLHAWTVHSKLGRAPVEVNESSEAEREKSTNQQDFGTATHKIALGYGREICVIDPNKHMGPRGGIPKGWTNHSIQTARYEAMQSGLIPILPKYHERAKVCAQALRENAEFWLQMPVEECLREIVICWEENGFWRKAMIDIARPDLLKLADFKTTGICVSAESAARHMYAEDMEVQAAFYIRGADAIQPENMGRREFAFLFAEQRPPHACSPPIIPSEAGMEGGRWTVDYACKLWDECLAKDEWPSYPYTPYYAQPPAWKLARMGNDL